MKANDLYSQYKQESSSCSYESDPIEMDFYSSSFANETTISTILDQLSDCYNPSFNYSLPTMNTSFSCSTVSIEESVSYQVSVNRNAQVSDFESHRYPFMTPPVLSEESIQLPCNNESNGAAATYPNKYLYQPPPTTVFQDNSNDRDLPPSSASITTADNTHHSSPSATRTKATKRYGCSLCHRDYSRSQDLSRHYQSRHTEIKKFKCECCDKAFARKDALLRHQKAAQLKTSRFSHTHNIKHKEK